MNDLKVISERRALALLPELNDFDSLSLELMLIEALDKISRGGGEQSYGVSYDVRYISCNLTGLFLNARHAELLNGCITDWSNEVNREAKGVCGAEGQDAAIAFLQTENTELLSKIRDCVSVQNNLYRDAGRVGTITHYFGRKEWGKRQGAGENAA